MSNSDFFNRYKDDAISSMDTTGVPASITLAQAALESGYGKSLLAVKDNNFFGVKAGNKWTGKKSLWQTTEWIPLSKASYYQTYFTSEGRQIISKGEIINGKQKWIVKDYFRSYSSPSESFKDHSMIYAVRKASDIANGSKDFNVWADALKTAGYATDLAYPQKLKTIINQNNLSIYDTQVVKKKLIRYVLVLLSGIVIAFGFAKYKNLLTNKLNYVYTFLSGCFIGFLINVSIMGIEYYKYRRNAEDEIN